MKFPAYPGGPGMKETDPGKAPGLSGSFHLNRLGLNWQFRIGLSALDQVSQTFQNDCIVSKIETR